MVSISMDNQRLRKRIFSRGAYLSRSTMKPRTLSLTSTTSLVHQNESQVAQKRLKRQLILDLPNPVEYPKLKTMGNERAKRLQKARKEAAAAAKEQRRGRLGSFVDMYKPKYLRRNRLSQEASVHLPTTRGSGEGAVSHLRPLGSSIEYIFDHSSGAKNELNEGDSRQGYDSYHHNGDDDEQDESPVSYGGPMTHRNGPNRENGNIRNQINKILDGTVLEDRSGEEMPSSSENQGSSQESSGIVQKSALRLPDELMSQDEDRENNEPNRGSEDEDMVQSAKDIQVEEPKEPENPSSSFFEVKPPEANESLFKKYQKKNDLLVSKNGQFVLPNIA